MLAKNNWKTVISLLFGTIGILFFVYCVCWFVGASFSTGLLCYIAILCTEIGWRLRTDNGAYLFHEE
jgi:hypothetical protein